MRCQGRGFNLEVQVDRGVAWELVVCASLLVNLSSAFGQVLEDGVWTQKLWPLRTMISTLLLKALSQGVFLCYFSPIHPIMPAGAWRASPLTCVPDDDLQGACSLNKGELCCLRPWEPFRRGCCRRGHPQADFPFGSISRRNEICIFKAFSFQDRHLTRNKHFRVGLDTPVLCGNDVTI